MTSKPFILTQALESSNLVQNAEATNIFSDHTWVGKQQDDPELANYIRHHFLQPPASRSQPYNLAQPDITDFSEFAQSEYLDQEYLHGMVRNN